VSFDDALALLLSLVGERVEVAIQSPASGLIAHFSGTLARGHELSPRVEPAPVFFSFGDGGTGFVIAPHAFARALRGDDDHVIQIEDRAGVVVVVERAPSDRP
jgi:hypothetical protein